MTKTGHIIEAEIGATIDRYRVPKFVPIYLGIVWSH